MSQQIGMQMPGGRSGGGSGIDIFTGLMFIAVLALLAATVVAYVQGGKIAPEGDAFAMHEKDKPVRLATP